MSAPSLRLRFVSSRQLFTALALLGLALVSACGGGAGHGAEADGPPPSGGGKKRALGYVEDEPAKPKAPTTSPQGDGTSTEEIVDSVEQD
ncbi:MAG: hypothetical protein RJA70_55 [Pseudomonadota bacterium]|jgi:hypothetical protein